MYTIMWDDTIGRQLSRCIYNASFGITQVLQDDEKLLLQSNQWGSFFTNTSADMHGNTVTFWMSLLQQYSELAVPSLNHLSGQFSCLSDVNYSFYFFKLGQFAEECFQVKQKCSGSMNKDIPKSIELGNKDTKPLHQNDVNYHF